VRLQWLRTVIPVENEKKMMNLTGDINLLVLGILHVGIVKSHIEKIGMRTTREFTLQMSKKENITIET